MISIKKLFVRNKQPVSPPSLISMELDDLITGPLKKAKYDLTEESLARCIKENKSKTLVYYAVLALRKYGTYKSIGLLKQTVNYPMADVKVCAVLAIGAIAGSKETQYYSDLLDGPAFKDKLFAMAVIWEVGDERAKDAVVRLAEKVLANKIKLNNLTEASYIAEYLERFENDESITLAHRLRQLDLPRL